MLFSLVKDWFTTPKENEQLEKKYQPTLKHIMIIILMTPTTTKKNRD